MYINLLIVISLCFVVTIGSPSCQMTDRLPEPGCCGKNGGPYEADRSQLRSSYRIVGGNSTDLHLYPWMALLEYKIKPNGSTYLCGGSLITGRLVVTAAHCVTPDPPISVRLGAYRRRSVGEDCISTASGFQCTDEPKSISVFKIDIHEDYDASPGATKVNDIAFLRLTEMAPYTDFIRPICLPSSDVTLEPPPNLKLYAAGWGIMLQTCDDDACKNITNKFSIVKQHVKLPYVPLEECKKRWRDVVDTQICAGGEAGKATCMGDSGGPIMNYKNGVFELAGIISYGYEICGIQELPGVYTNVFSFRDMVNSVIQKLST